MKKKKDTQVVSLRLQSLPVIITSDERMEKGVELARTMELISEVESAKKESATDYNSRIEAHKRTAGMLANVVKTGRIYQDVEVKTVHDYDDFTVISTRTDTGEVIHERAMDAVERQKALEFEEGDGVALGDRGEGE